MPRATRPTMPAVSMVPLVATAASHGPWLAHSSGARRSSSATGVVAGCSYSLLPDIADSHGCAIIISI